MRRNEVKKILTKTPNVQLIEFFFEQANLTKEEKAALRACVRDGMTYEEAEEELSFCVRTIGRKNKAAMEKLSAYLECMRWLLDCPIYK